MRSSFTTGEEEFEKLFFSSPSTGPRHKEEDGIVYSAPLGINGKKAEDTITLPKEAKNAGLSIIGYPTNKSKIKQRPTMKENIIPSHASSCIFNGKSGSGKSMLLVNLMSRPEFYGPDLRTARGKKGLGYFDIVVLFSPTANGGDDLVRFLKLPESRIFTEFDQTILDNIISTQKQIISSKGLEKSPKILIIMEDIQSDTKFMNSKAFLKCFIMCRHLNISTFLLGQSWTKTPRAARLQANNIFYFPGSLSEEKLLAQEFTPPKMTERQFRDLIGYATDGPHSFLHINMRGPMRERFRKKLDEILDLVD